ncbi:tRNA (adenosine(37)-N6)-dimethylallyltransferase MiaA [Flagellimonas allohymeniacidonis]|uniref:tRNA dimethylallyltransferase n=1 Tax=Flagellimonas allohymeniacidonis TaxID=2517819 RepID=A0A4Q8QF06_9FLAO|nr:tRNA (adenosine(37)-N6)-dimethylallyltransferase MiaA [Allomuricauda hymeniacidonis]TAI49055.1 tRNA (adenosine(37)-N6)-dimethylallyltransferase MiaA [Allomuricauda hymeniacidonis]
MNQKTLLAVVGPTAIGKTRLAIALAKHFNTEIISADSRQFFKEMRIGTAVPSSKELTEAKHHFIQHKSIHETYSVGDFEKEVMALLHRLFQEKDTVVLVGGSGLYVDALVKGLDEFPEVNPKIRKTLNKRLLDEGIESLQRELKARDPLYYDQVDLMNPHRVIRALEVSISSGRPFSSFRRKHKTNRFFQTVYVGIDADRAIIYDRINRRVDSMMDEGLLDEARQLHPFKELNALQTVGYRELFEFFEEKCTLDFAVEEIKKNTRRFAKRQLTWLRKNEHIIWSNYADPLEKIIQRIKNEIGASND